MAACQNSPETDENAPNSEQESLESQVITFLESVNVPVEPNEISACHTLKTRDRTRPPLIVMKFVNRKSKERVLKTAAKNRRDLKREKVFINEHLTSKNAKIAKQARILWRQRCIISTWTRNGTVFVKYLDNNNATKVMSVKELSYLTQFEDGQLPQT